jgi:hypothetical protein
MARKVGHRKIDEDEEVTDSRRNVKITEDDFVGVPHLKTFAVHAKSYFRKQASLGSAFPPRGPVERHDFILKLLEDAANDTSDDNTAEKYSHLVSDLAATNENLFEKLCTFVRSLFSSLSRPDSIFRLCMERDN